MSASKAGTGLFFVLLASAIPAQTTVRVSVGVNEQPNGLSYLGDVAPDGRFVVFESNASNLVIGDTNQHRDIFIRDRREGTTERISVSSTGEQTDAPSFAGWVTPDGRYVAFSSDATTLVPRDTNHKRDVFVRDLWNHTTERVSVGTNGEEGNGTSFGEGISRDGRFVLFESDADNLVPGDTNGLTDVFVRDRWNGTTERVNTDSSGAQAQPGIFDFADGGSAMSADGRMVVFVSNAPNLVPDDTNIIPDVFVKDRETGVTVRVSVSTDGRQQESDFLDVGMSCCISADGRYVGFNCQASNLVPGDTNGWFDGFVHDMRTGVTDRVTVDSAGHQAPPQSGAFMQALSADGRYATFYSSSNFLPGGAGTPWHWDLYLRDRLAATTERVGLSWNGSATEGNGADGWVSDDGRFVAFASPSDELVVDDTNGTQDVFMRDRTGGTDFVRLCEPGVDGVASCPCSNPPGGPDQGCNNSSGSGGAVLSASGATFLSSDSLQFEVARANAGGLCVLFQGDALVATGDVYGQGVRCAGGSIRRLFVERASAGNVTIPDFSVGEDPISVRSEAKGDAIRAGQRRWYFVSYRDSIVQGGCSLSATFNATPTGEITWAP